ncbi:hypothetical protein GCM10010277_77540 [Streptomyces longisporoflavus]|nr:hypothetical protein GCM10010277_77540 [Streptomyces longisporoflavus]
MRPRAQTATGCELSAEALGRTFLDLPAADLGHSLRPRVVTNPAGSVPEITMSPLAVDACEGRLLAETEGTGRGR